MQFNLDLFKECYCLSHLLFPCITCCKKGLQIRLLFAKWDEVPAVSDLQEPHKTYKWSCRRETSFLPQLTAFFLYIDLIFQMADYKTSYFFPLNTNALISCLFFFLFNQEWCFENAITTLIFTTPERVHFFLTHESIFGAKDGVPGMCFCLLGPEVDFFFWFCVFHFVTKQIAPGSSWLAPLLVYLENGTPG